MTVIAEGEGLLLLVMPVVTTRNTLAIVAA